ncbi:MAG: SBBP repeat-containing protein [Bdellovibrionota bacterium]
MSECLSNRSVRAYQVGLAIAFALTFQFLAANVGFAIAPSTDPALTSAHVKQSAIARAYGALPLRFEPNVGQVDPDVRYVARGHGHTTYLKERELQISLCGAAASDQEDRSITITLNVGKDAATKLIGQDELPSRSNYFIGNDPSRWRTNVPQFRSVRAESPYSGISLVYYGQSQSELEFDFVIQPGSDSGQIELDYGGVRRLSVDSSGALVLDTACGPIRQDRPTVYQDSKDGRRVIDGSYVLRGDRSVGFAVGSYDHSLPLTIDPVIVASSYLGGDSAEYSFDLAVDSAGDAYVTGYTSSSSLPGINGGVYSTKSGMSDVFVTKISGGGTVVRFSTYLGGADNDAGLRLAPDPNGGGILVAGQAISSDFPMVNAAQPNRRGMVDGFVTKLNSNGDRIVYSTYLGGDDAGGGSVSNDSANGLAVDTSGNAYVVFYTASPTMTHLTKPGAIASGLPCAGCVDAYVVKLDPTGQVVYGTYFGGRGVLPDDLAIDSTGAVYLTGQSTGNFGFAVPTPGAVTTYRGGQYDAFAAKINPTGTARVYATFLGGTRGEVGHGIVVDNGGSAYVVGSTSSSDFPTVGAFQPNNGGSADAFVTKLTPTGMGFVYSTFLGGQFNEEARAIAVDDDGNAYVVGSTESPAFPIYKEFQRLNGIDDGFIIKLAPTGDKAVYSSFLGGEGADEARGVAISGKSVFIAGITNSTTFPLRQPFQAANGGGWDCFLVRLGEPGFFLR